MVKSNGSAAVEILDTKIYLLPEKAIYIESWQTLLIADVHLGKSETFQALGVPISNQVNHGTLHRLHQLCMHYDPKTLIILGDLFHSRQALTSDVICQWERFLQTTNCAVWLVVGNHDRGLLRSLPLLSITCHQNMIDQDGFIFSHEPVSQPDGFNLCGHIHPCVRLKTKLDHLRLPCFYLDQTQHCLILPSFGEFTGGFEMSLKGGAIAYVIAENTVIPLQGG